MNNVNIRLKKKGLQFNALRHRGVHQNIKIPPKNGLEVQQKIHKDTQKYGLLLG